LQPPCHYHCLDEPRRRLVTIIASSCPNEAKPPSAAVRRPAPDDAPLVCPRSSSRPWCPTSAFPSAPSSAKVRDRPGPACPCRAALAAARRVLCDRPALCLPSFYHICTSMHVALARSLARTRARARSLLRSIACSLLRSIARSLARTRTGAGMGRGVGAWQT
jgi:hypothetical protein